MEYKNWLTSILRSELSVHGMMRFTLECLKD